MGIGYAVLQVLTWGCLWDNPSDGGGYFEAVAYHILKFHAKDSAGTTNWGVITTWMVTEALLC